ncbi:uncharacterized protein LOC134811473 [Bolinopsis microptera]|uniref:uncharacterized protein LOC134811473 n=1 Tax=Bolinopsis microptera TaxID=2820187 RepID=UPI003078BEB8
MNDENPGENVPVVNERYFLRPRRANPAQENQAADGRQAAVPQRDVQPRRPLRRRPRPQARPRLSPPRRRRRQNPNPRNDNPVQLDPERPLLNPGWLNVDLEGLNFNNEDSDDEEDTDYDTDASSDDTSSTTSSNEVPIPLFRINEDEDDNDDEDGDEDDNLIQWHPDPFEPFGLNFERGMDLNNFMDVFRRIAYGLNSTRSSIQLDTLPAPRPLDPEKIDLYNGNLPPLGSIPMHRNFLIPPFTNVIVDAMPTQIQRRHIFFTNYTRDCWNGLQDSAKQSELRALKSKIWVTVETSAMLQRYYPILYLEIQDLLNRLIPNRLYQILVEDPVDRLSVIALPLDTIPGSCMYFMSKDCKFLLHTGSNAGQESFVSSFRKIKEITPVIDTLYIDTALYFPGSDESFRKKLESRNSAMSRIKSFMTTMVSNTEHNYFFSIQYRAGMEKFMLDIVSWAKNWKIGITEDLYEWNYRELLDHRDRTFKVDHLDHRLLNQVAQEQAHIFFYTAEQSNFDHLHSTNCNHIKLHVIYDYHSSIERVREPRCCSSTIYRKCRAFNNDSDSEETDLNYYILYPSHPTTSQTKSIVKQLKPEKIFGLSRAPGVGLY